MSKTKFRLYGERPEFGTPEFWEKLTEEMRSRKQGGDQVTASVKLGQYKETPEYRAPDEGFYIATLDDWDEPVRSAYADRVTGEFPLRINLKFVIVSDISGDDEFKGLSASKFCDLDLNPKSKNSIWGPLVALDPANEPEPEMELDTYRGRKCVIEVVHKKKDSTTAPGKVNIFANVGAVKAHKAKKQAAAPARNPLLDDDDE